MSAAIHRVGTRALLIELGELDLALRWHTHLSAHPLPGQRELIAAAATVLVVLDSARHAARAARTLGSLTPRAATASSTRRVEVEVVYDGPDLEDTADLLGISPEELVNWHTGTRWRAAFRGFAPQIRLLLPRRAEAGAPGAAPEQPAHPGAARRGGPGGLLLRRLPAYLPRRLAADRPFPHPHVGLRCYPARHNPPRARHALPRGPRVH